MVNPTGSSLEYLGVAGGYSYCRSDRRLPLDSLGVGDPALVITAASATPATAPGEELLAPTPSQRAAQAAAHAAAAGEKAR